MRKNTEIRYQISRCDSFLLTSDGMLRAKAKIARIGVQDYYDRDGELVREYRSKEEVIASIDSFKNKPLTLNHPPEFINADNAQEYLKGFVSSVEYKDGWLEAEITITHRDAIEKALATHKYFSCGYFVVPKEELGVWVDSLGVQGEAGAEYNYSIAQTLIYGNHIALTNAPRAGKQATFCDNSEINITQDTKDISYMTEIKYNDQTYKIEGEQSSKVAELVKELGVSIDTLQAKVDALTLEKTQALAEMKTKEDSLPHEINERVELWQAILPVIDSDVDYSLEPVEIKKLYLKKVFPELVGKIDTADAAYIDALYDVKPAVQEASINEQVKEAVTSNKKADSSYESLNQAYLDSQKEYINRRMNKGNN